jgi:hypothetical protein
MRALRTDAVDLNQIIALTEDQARSRYNVGSNTLYKVADEAGANIRIGKKRLYSRIKLDQYFNEELIEC